MRPSVWTSDRVARLTRLWGSGMSARLIAEDLGCGISRDAVIGKAHRLRLAGRLSPINWEPLADSSRPATIAIESLTAQSCRYPIGDPLKAGFRFCCRRQAAGSSFCAEHHRIVWKRAR